MPLTAVLMMSGLVVIIMLGLSKIRMILLLWKTVIIISQ